MLILRVLFVLTKIIFLLCFVFLKYFVIMFVRLFYFIIFFPVSFLLFFKSILFLLFKFIGYLFFSFIKFIKENFIIFKNFYLVEPFYQFNNHLYSFKTFKERLFRRFYFYRRSYYVSGKSFKLLLKAV